MTSGGIDKLLRISGPPICTYFPSLSPASVELAGALWSGLRALLTARNGFYAFSSALHVFPAEQDRRTLGLTAWNSAALWRSEYAESADGCWFFAEDLVGGQYCFFRDTIHKFNPETGEKTALCASIEEWAALLLRNQEEETLWPLGEEWQARERPLASGERLVPKVPFVLGGEFTADNLYAADSTRAMRFYAHVAKQIKNLPDGARIELRTIE